MAVSEVSIINRALIMLGQTVITSRSDATNSARSADAIFDEVRDTILQSHPWNEAVARVTLSKLSTNPVHGYDYAHALPSDFLRALPFADDTIDISYEVQGGVKVVVSDTTPLKLVYIKRITDPVQMSPLLRNAISAALSVELALTLTGDKAKLSQMKEMLRDVMAEARFVDSQQAWPHEDIAGYSWIREHWNAHDDWGRTITA